MRVISFTPHKRSKTSNLEYEASDKEPIAVLPYDDYDDVAELDEVLGYRPILKRRVWRKMEKMRKQKPVYRHVLVKYKSANSQTNRPLARF
jgi:hypothetical protein